MSGDNHRLPLLKRVATGAVVTFAGTVFGKGMQACIHLMISRLFGAYELGIFVIGMNLIQLIRVVASLGLPKGGMRFLSMAIGSNGHDRIPGIVETAILLPLTLSLILSPVLFARADSLASLWFKDAQLAPVFRAFAFSLPFATILGAGVDLSKGFNTTVYSVKTENIFIPLSRVGLFFLLFLLGYGFQSIIYAVVLSTVLGALLILYFLVKQVRREPGSALGSLRAPGRRQSLAERKEIVVYSLPLFLTGMTIMIMQSCDIFMLGYFMDSSEVGIYAAASTLATFFTTLLVTSLGSIFAPVVATRHGSGNVEDVKHLYLSTTRWMFAVCMPYVVAVITARNFIMLVFGESFVAEGSTILLILTLGQAMNCLTGGVGIILAMTGQQYKELFTNVMVVLVNVLLNILLIPRMGAVGAAVATSISYIAVNTIRFIIIYNIYGVQPFTERLIKTTVGVFAIVIFSFFIHHVLPAFDLPCSILATALTIWLILATSLEDEDREILNIIRTKVRAGPRPSL